MKINVEVDTKSIDYIVKITIYTIKAKKNYIKDNNKYDIIKFIINKIILHKDGA